MTNDELCEEITEYVMQIEEECESIDLKDFDALKNDMLKRYDVDCIMYRFLVMIFDIVIKDVYKIT